MAQDIKKLSAHNLQRCLEKHQRRKRILSVELQNQILDGLLAWHCVKDENILGVFIKQRITTKQESIDSNAKLTNNAQDYIQGFDHCLSMSIGIPWTEYGPYAFAYGFDKIDDDALFFDEDPWKFDSDKLQKRLFIKKDFLILQGELLSSKLYRIYGDLYIKLPFVFNYHRLLRHNVRHWEIKQTKNLNIEEAEEFVIYNQLHSFICSVNRLLYWRGFVFLFLTMIFLKVVL